MCNICDGGQHRGVGKASHLGGQPFYSFGALSDSGSVETFLTTHIDYYTHEVLKSEFEKELKRLGLD